MKKIQNQLRAGVVLSYINMALGMVIPFFYTPVMLRVLGQAEYGLFSLAHSVVAYLSLLSFGFGTTIIRYVAKYRAEQDVENLEKIYGFFILIYCGMAILVLSIGSVLANCTNTIFHRGLVESEQVTMQYLIYIMTVSSALSFPLSVFSSMVIAHEKYIFRNIINIFTTVVGPAANLIALWLGYKSIGMASSALAVSLFTLPINIIYCSRILKLRPRFARIPHALVKEMLCVSFFNFLGSIVDMLFWATDKVILGMLASSVAVAIYNVGVVFNHIIISLSTTISGVLAPRVTGLIVKNASKEELTNLFVRVGRLQFLIIGLVISGFVVFGKIFVCLWAGDGYVESYKIALLTILPLCIPLIQNTGITILVAQNKQKFRSIIYFVIAVINVISTYMLVPIWGGIGAAFCSCVSYFLGQGLVMNIYYHNVTGIDIWKFWKTILGMSIVPGTMMVVGVICCQYLKLTCFSLFFIAVFLFSGIYSILMWFLIMNDYEKDIFRKPVLSLLWVVKKGR